jgi:hypothetical protein
MPDIIDQCIDNKDTEVYKLMHDLLSADTPDDAIKKWKELRNVIRMMKNEIEEEELQQEDFLTIYLQERN